MRAHIKIVLKGTVDANVYFAPNNTPPQHAIEQPTNHPPTLIML